MLFLEIFYSCHCLSIEKKDMDADAIVNNSAIVETKRR